VSILPQPAVLYLVHRLPYPPDKGDRIRAYHLLRHLSGRAAVHLACLADEPVSPEALAALRALCARVEVVRLAGWSRWPRGLWSLASGRTVSEGVFRSAALFDTVRTWALATPFSAALASASSVAPYLRVPELAGVPKVVDLVDVDSQKWFDYAAATRGPLSWLYRTEGTRLRRLEQGLAKRVRAVTVVSDAEATLFRSFCPDAPVQAVTNGVDLKYFAPAPVFEEQACVFVGALDYKPNVEGIGWFCREVWPTIQQPRPGAKLYVVGRKPTPTVRRLGELPGVEVVGGVPDVRPSVARSAVAVVPLHIARGVQNKLLEALAMGKAAVASPQALAGVPAEPGTHLLGAATAAEWIDAIGKLLGDEALRRRLGGAGRRFVEERHSWDRCLAPFETLLGL
jgi:polysaccharide biosynthesis protein PslH